MTDREMQAILDRNPGNVDVLALKAEIDGYMDKLTDCWLLIDEMARDPLASKRDSEAPVIVAKARRLLRKQQVPGWKT